MNIPVFITGRLLIRRRILKACSGLWLVTAAVLQAQDPELRLNPVFGSHAVLQNGVCVPVWGTASPGSRVTVSFAEQTVTADTAETGKWKAVLQPLAVSAVPQKMVVSDGRRDVVLEDILVGEVWLVCGRSNIGFTQMRMVNAEQERQKADQPLLRLLKVETKDPALTPSAGFSTRGWQSASPETVGSFSAVGWVFGSELQKARQVPVGIIMSSWGGSRANMWIEKSFLEACQKGVPPPNRESADFEAASRQYHQGGDGQTISIPNDAGVCFNSHIYPLIPVAMKGAVVFFDGAPADEIRLLAYNWRSLWGAGDFPFIFIQTHRQGGPVQESPDQKSNYSRAEYLPLLKTIPRSALVVTLDTGVEGPKDIHPPNKRPVGERVALAARTLAYGEGIVGSGPVFSSMKAAGNRAILFFDHTGSGLEASGGSLEGFAATEDGQTWIWADAAIEGSTVVVVAPGLKNIRAVRYAFGGDNPRGNLFNKEGLPASPFVSP